jgi:hypothetical protein
LTPQRTIAMRNSDQWLLSAKDQPLAKIRRKQAAREDLCSVLCDDCVIETIIDTDAHNFVRDTAVGT